MDVSDGKEVLLLALIAPQAAGKVPLSLFELIASVFSADMSAQAGGSVLQTKQYVMQAKGERDGLGNKASRVPN